MQLPIRVLPLALCSLPLIAQPRIADRGIVNSASNFTPGLPSSGIARGSLFTVYGERLGPAQLANAAGLPLPTDLAASRIRVRAAGNDYAAFVVYTTATQMAAILPSAIPEGKAEVTVVFEGKESPPIDIDVRGAAFGIFSQNQAGCGPASVQNYIATTAAPRVNTIVQAAQPGQVVILWGTGLGPIRGSDADRPSAGDLPVDVEVFVGGRQATVLYKGRSPEFPGLDQINFVVPDGVLGCYIPVVVRAGGVMSNFTSISIGMGTVCGDTVSFRGPLLAAGMSDGVLRIGTVDLTHGEIGYPDAPPVYWSEGGLANFYEVQRDDVGQIGGLFDYEVPTGHCTVTMRKWTSADDIDELFPQIHPRRRMMEAGLAVTVRSATGQRRLARGGPGEYESVIGGMSNLGGPAAARFLTPGTYTVENEYPSPDTGSIRATITIPGEVQWVNKANLTQVDRTKDLTFEWTGGFDGREYVVVGGSSADETLKTRMTFLCAERAGARSLTVPASILGMLPKSSEIMPTSTFPSGMLFLGNSSTNTVVTAEPGNLDMLYLRYLFLYASVVDFK